MVAQRLDNVLDAHAELGQLGGGEFQEHLFFVDTPQLHLADAVKLVEAVANIAGRLAHLPHGESFGPQGDGGYGNQAEFIVDEGADGANR